ncbi:MAG: serine/threonine-protein kinase [Myxococcota bacterium]
MISARPSSRSLASPSRNCHNRVTGLVPGGMMQAQKDQGQTSSVPKSGAPASLDLPRQFGRFTLFDHIGRGGMADIFLALLQGDVLERRVVIKQILPHLSDDPGFGDMLISEAKLAAHLGHANVVQTYELGREDGQLFIAMEYVEGFDLNRLLRRLTEARIGLPAEFALLIVRDVLRALDYAHRARDGEGTPMGLVHRDVSPSNVLVSFEGEVKLCDFGIARAMTASPDESRVARARVAGKSAYMAPEHARGESIDARADVFAAGILLHELAAGRRMYRGSEEEMLAQAKAGAVPRLRDRGLPAHDRLQAILDRALAADADHRYRSAAGFLAELEDYAIEHRLMASQLKFGTFLTDYFAEEIVDVRAARERAARVERSPVEQDSFVRAVPSAGDGGESAEHVESGFPVDDADTAPNPLPPTDQDALPADVQKSIANAPTEMLPAITEEAPSVPRWVWAVAVLLIVAALGVAVVLAGQ